MGEIIFQNGERFPPRLKWCRNVVDDFLQLRNDAAEMRRGKKWELIPQSPCIEGLGKGFRPKWRFIEGLFALWTSLVLKPRRIFHVIIRNSADVELEILLA